LQVSGAPNAGRLYLVAARGVLAICDLDATACTQAVPLGSGGSYGAAVETGGRVFVPDYATGRVWIIDLRRAQVVGQAQVLSPDTHFQLLTRDGVVFFNDPASERAGVLRLDGSVQQVPKYDPGDPGKGVIGHGSGEKAPLPPDNPANAPDTPPAPGLPAAPAPTNQNGGASVLIVLSKPRALVGEVIALRGQTTGGRGPVRATWAFGDGQGATGLNTVHRWDAAGTYQVSVNVRFADGETAAASLPIQITTVPPATTTLTVQVTGNGTVTSQPPGVACPPTCSAPFVTSDTVTLTPAPGPGQQFVTWAGDCTGGAACTVAMSQNRRVSASFNQAPVTVNATVSAIKGSYSGSCPPPKTATTYQAVISVSSGPVTVSFRWTSSNGGDTDPSTKTLTFTGAGPQSQTVTHNEAFYLPGQTINDWIAVDLMTPTSGQSNHAAYQLTCTQAPPPPPTVTATVSAINGSYTGPCPPPKTATTYRAVITVSSGPVTVTFRWTSSNGGDTDPSTKTLTFSGTGRQSQTVTHNESFYLPGQTVNDWIAVDLMTPTSGQSNHAAYQLTCT
jgi:PKD domain/Divergent InlB B-repeat domain